jgi:hypothetical protein
MEQYEQILLKYECPLRDGDSGPLIAAIEEVAGFPLPRDYKEYLRKFSGFEGDIGPEYLYLSYADEVIKMNNNCGIPANLPKTIGIGGNGSSEFIAIEFIDNGSYRVVLSPLIDLDKQYHIEIGSSFTDFLVRLDNGKEWFNNVDDK